jgi:hypothetical protein
MMLIELMDLPALDLIISINRDRRQVDDIWVAPPLVGERIFL